MSKVTAVCQECGTQFEYELKPGFPRKYCFKCSAIKKADYEGVPVDKKPEVVKPGNPISFPNGLPNKPKANGSMYASYAKDIFVVMWPDAREKGINASNIMIGAIELVKQAKEAFE